ncbi:MAG: hypothetical protein LBR44_06850 [Clostridiales Family XIII bacterium]|jgi:hypothetical protein|nr:hypothetical protein [Clostridiales Family XIII bacterium]
MTSAQSITLSSHLPIEAIITQNFTHISNDLQRCAICEKRIGTKQFKGKAICSQCLALLAGM